MKIEIKKLEKSEVQFDIVIPSKDFEKYHDKGFKKIQEVVSVDGFRKGNAPEDAITKNYGDMILLEEMANLALRDAYMEAIKEHKIIPVADPNVVIKKLAKGNDLELTITVPVMPEVTLPNYKKIGEEKSKEHTMETVTDKDIADVLEELRKGRAEKHHHDHEHKDGEKCEHTDEEKNLPELNDEFAQSFGEEFKSLEDLKKKISENLKLEKSQKNTEKIRTAIIENLIKESKAEIPEVMIEQELERMLGQMKNDVARFGGKWEDYLTHSKKTEEELKKDWRLNAEKRTLSQLVLAEISLVEKIKPTDEEIETELTRLLATIQDLDEERARGYIFQVLTNEKVLKFLEGNK